MAQPTEKGDVRESSAVSPAAPHRPTAPRGRRRPGGRQYLRRGAGRCSTRRPCYARPARPRGSGRRVPGDPGRAPAPAAGAGRLAAGSRRRRYAATPSRRPGWAGSSATRCVAARCVPGPGRLLLRDRVRITAPDAGRDTIDATCATALGPDLRVEHPHRTGAGQPQAGAAAARPRRADRSASPSSAPARSPAGWSRPRPPR